MFYINSICLKHACDNIFVYMQSNKNVLGAAGVGISPDSVKKWDQDCAGMTFDGSIEHINCNLMFFFKQLHDVHELRAWYKSSP